MQTANLLPLVLILAAVAFWLSFQRSRAVAAPLGGVRHLKALPTHYAARAALWSAIPGLVLLGLWAGFEGKVIHSIVMASLPEGMAPDSAGQASLLFTQISNVARGSLNPDLAPEAVVQAAALLENLREQSRVFKTVLVILVTVLGAAFA